MSNKPGQGFLGPPKEPGEERLRACPICRKTTFQTYKVMSKVFGGKLRYWECNECGEHRSYIEQ